MASSVNTLTMSITPFYSMRQYYYAIEEGIVESDTLEIEFEYNHSPVKDHVILCGDVDATTMSMGKYVMAKSISHTYTLPVDPFAIAVEAEIVETNGLFSHIDSGIEEPNDLVGKRVGFHDKTLSLTYHKTILEEVYDVPVDEIEWVFDTHQGLTTQMEEGTIDVVERVGDWYWNLNSSPEHTRLYSLGDEWHSFKGYHPMAHLIVVDKALFDGNEEVFDEFVDLLHRSKAYRDENYEEILEALVNEEDSSKTEWTGDRSVEDVKRLTDGLHIPFELDEIHRQNIQDWIGYAKKYDVLNREIREEELYPLP